MPMAAEFTPLPLSDLITRPPRRVVSLVPSMTESLFGLGSGESLVGVTDYCLHPAQALEKLPRLGGPKNPDVEGILALQPDLVLANWEENTRPPVEALRAAGVKVWVTLPRTVRQSLDILWELAGAFHSQAAVMRLEMLERQWEWAQAAAPEPAARLFCPIWYDQTQDGLPWWMTFNRDTYCHDLLVRLGGDNVFADRARRYPLDADLGLAHPHLPGERDTRYPRVPLEEVIAAQPEVVLLPDEPFPFAEEHRQETLQLLAETPAGKSGRIYLVEGSLITWHGTRLAKAMQALPELLA